MYFWVVVVRIALLLRESILSCDFSRFLLSYALTRTFLFYSLTTLPSLSLSLSARPVFVVWSGELEWQREMQRVRARQHEEKKNAMRPLRAQRVKVHLRDDKLYSTRIDRLWKCSRLWPRNASVSLSSLNNGGGSGGVGSSGSRQGVINVIFSTTGLWLDHSCLLRSFLTVSRGVIALDASPQSLFYSPISVFLLSLQGVVCT